MIQQAVQRLCAIAPQLTDTLDTDQLAEAVRHIDALDHPLGKEDIRALMALLPANGDTASGLNWSLLHAIEASPHWPLWELLTEAGNEWTEILQARLHNAGISQDRPCQTR